jgi:hypothetical protein
MRVLSMSLFSKVFKLQAVKNSIQFTGNLAIHVYIYLKGMFHELYHILSFYSIPFNFLFF